MNLFSEIKLLKEKYQIFLLQCHISDSPAGGGLLQHPEGAQLLFLWIFLTDFYLITIYCWGLINHPHLTISLYLYVSAVPMKEIFSIGGFRLTTLPSIHNQLSEDGCLKLNLCQIDCCAIVITHLLCWYPRLVK